jgi:hypothetical protein
MQAYPLDLGPPCLKLLRVLEETTNADPAGYQQDTMPVLVLSANGSN